MTGLLIAAAVVLCFAIAATVAFINDQYTQLRWLGIRMAVKAARARQQAILDEVLGVATDRQSLRSAMMSLEDRMLQWKAGPRTNAEYFGDLCEVALMIQGKLARVQEQPADAWPA